MDYMRILITNQTKEETYKTLKRKTKLSQKRTLKMKIKRKLLTIKPPFLKKRMTLPKIRMKMFKMEKSMNRKSNRIKVASLVIRKQRSRRKKIILLRIMRIGKLGTTMVYITHSRPTAINLNMITTSK